MKNQSEYPVRAQICSTLPPDLLYEAKEKAWKNHMKFSSYLESLIREDLESDKQSNENGNA